MIGWILLGLTLAVSGFLLYQHYRDNLSIIAEEKGSVTLGVFGIAGFLGFLTTAHEPALYSFLIVIATLWIIKW